MKTDPKTIKCPVCGAEPGESCAALLTGERKASIMKGMVHAGRISAADKIPPKLRTVKDALADIEKHFGHIEGECVTGFMITVQTPDKSRMQFAWGDNKKLVFRR